MLKRLFKQNSHNILFKALAGFGRSLNRLYENRNHDMRSNGELRLIKKFSKLNPSIIIDGGANIGKYSLTLKTYCADCTIYAFEPVKDTFEELQVNTQAHTAIIAVNQGLYSEKISKHINLFPSHTHSSLYPIHGLSDQPIGTTEIELISGDKFAEDHNIEHIDLVKLDLEGAEYEAIVGFQKMLANGQIRMVQFEYGYINITTKRLLLDFYQLFQTHGYIVGKVFPKTVEFRKYQFKYEDFLGPNFVAVKETDQELIDLLT